jgi:hypothetical protein
MSPGRGNLSGSGSDDSAAQTTDIAPAAAVSGLDEREVSVLRQVGEQWDRAVAGRSDWLHALPVDPALHRFPRFAAFAVFEDLRRHPHARPLPIGTVRPP